MQFTYGFASEADALLGVKDRALGQISTPTAIQLRHPANLPDKRLDTTSTAIYLVKCDFTDNLGTVFSANHPQVSDMRTMTGTEQLNILL